MGRRTVLKKDDPEFVYIRDIPEYSHLDLSVSYLETSIHEGRAQHKMFYTSPNGSAAVWFIPCSTDFLRRVREGEFNHLPDVMF